MRYSLVVTLALVFCTLCAADINSARIVGACQKYKWGNAIWREEYAPEGAENMKNPVTGVPLTGPKGYEHLAGIEPYDPTPMTPQWKAQWVVSQWSAVQWRFGMLSITGRPDGKEVTMTRKGGARYGRWESKVMIANKKSTTDSWRVLLELVPVEASQDRCGAQTITYGDYTKGTLKGSLQINALPNLSYQHSVPFPRGTEEAYHTFGVEVAKDHISWFVDDRVVMTETRKPALRHPKLTMRIRFFGTDDDEFPVPAGETPLLQFDWNRYWSLKRPNALPINRVPKCSRKTTNPDAC